MECSMQDKQQPDPVYGVDPEIGAIDFSGQMMGCLTVDRNGTPLRPSIIWADQGAEAGGTD
ncbi:MAG: hypothetical protein ACLVJO_03985 [[Clostridium] scindens]